MRFVILRAICYPADRNGTAPTIRGCPLACVGTPDSSTAGEVRTQPVRIRQAFEVLVDGDLALGTGPAGAAGGLPDHHGKTGWPPGWMVFLEDGRHFPSGRKADVEERLRAIGPALATTEPTLKQEKASGSVPSRLIGSNANGKLPRRDTR